MASRLLAGMLGGIAGIVPLAANAAVDYAATQGLLDATTAHWALSPVFSGPPALLLGVALGGVIAGWPAGRRGGAPAAAAAGGIAAGLYAVVVTGLVVGGARLGLVPSVAAVHPLRASAAVIFLASVLLAVAWLLGAMVGRGAETGMEASAGMARNADASAFVGGGDSRRQPGERWGTSQRGSSQRGYSGRNAYNDYDTGAHGPDDRSAYGPAYGQYDRRAARGYDMRDGHDGAGSAGARSRPVDRDDVRDGSGRGAGQRNASLDASRMPAGTRERRPGSRPHFSNRW